MRLCWCSYWNILLRHAELAKFLGLHALAARWRGGEAPRVDAPTPEVEGRWAVLGPLGVAPPSESGDAGHRATPQGGLGEALNEPLRALSEASPVEALVVVEPISTPPSLAGERVAEFVISRARAALGVRWNAVFLPSGEGLAARLGISLLPKARAQLVDLNRVHGAFGWMPRAAESSDSIGGDAGFFVLRDELTRLQDAGRHAEALQRLEADEVVDTIINTGALPILATKADNVEKDWLLNETIVQVAYEYDLPLVNVWRSLQDLAGRGIERKIYITPDGWLRRNEAWLKTLSLVQAEFNK